MSDYNPQPENNPNQQPGYDPNPQPGYDPNPQPGYNPNQQPGYDPYQQYSQQQYHGPVSWPHMKIGEWIIIKLLLLIPIANVIFMFVWALGSNVNPSKKSFFQAELIWSLIWCVISIVLLILMGGLIFTVFSDTLNQLI